MSGTLTEQRTTEPVRRRRRWRPRHLVTAAVLLVVGSTWFGLCLRYVAHPQIDPVEPVDAMFVIGPIEPRWEQALARADEGVTPVVLATISVDRQGAAYPRQECTDPPEGYTIICVLPEPYTTRGEARVLAQYVRDNGWTHVAVFTSTQHAARARMLMDRCVPAQVSIWDYEADRSPLGWLFDFAYQSSAWVKAQVLHSC